MPLRSDVSLLLARLVEYPRQDTAEAADSLRAVLEGQPELQRLAAGFHEFVVSQSLSLLEELYTRTFDIHAPVCLDVGYQLFGEAYKRGAFLVTMRGAARKAGVDEGTELPDHMGLILRLLPRLKEEDDPRGLVVEAVLPALVKMRAAFGRKPNAYAPLLALIDVWLRIEFAVRAEEIAQPGLGSFRLPVLQDGAEFFQGVNERE